MHCLQTSNISTSLCLLMAALLPLTLSCSQRGSLVINRNPAFVEAAAFLGSPLYRRQRERERSRSKSSIAFLQQLYPFRPNSHEHKSYLRHQSLYSVDIYQSETELKNMSGINLSKPMDSSPSKSFFDEQEFNAFQRAIEEIVSKKNVIRDFKKNEGDLDIVKGFLLEKERRPPHWDIHQYLPPKGSTEHAMSYTKDKVIERREMYLEQTGLSIPQHRLATTLLTHLADHCAKTRQPKPLYVAWEKILEAGLTPLSRVLSTYLYVLGNDKDGESMERDFAAEVAMFHDAIYEPTEKTITLLVKSLVRRGDAAGAEALLDGIADGALGDLRHRTTCPILKLYCEKGEVDSALRLYHRMRTSSRVKMDADTYCGFIASVAECGYFRSDSKPIDGATDLGYSSFGSVLLDELISDMAGDVLDISEENSELLHNGFALGFKESGMKVLQQSDHLTPLATLCEPQTIVADRVSVDKDTAKCLATNATLRLIVLEESERVHVHDTLIEMARVKSIDYTSKLAAKGRTTRDNAEQAELATQILKDFSDWLENREGRPYTAIIDGPNVAYFGWGRINLHQLMLMVDALEKQGEHPLVVMPEKYTRKKFYLRQGMVSFKTSNLYLLILHASNHTALFNRFKP